MVHDICGGGQLSYAFQKKLRSFFCKAAALYLSPFEETLLLDIDVVWFKKPDLLFEAPDYESTGALFFRDRFVHQRRDQKKDGLVQSKVEALIARIRNEAISLEQAKALSEINLFFRNTVNRSTPALQHIQESSVVLLRKSNHQGMLEVMQRLLPTYQQGYGDKELYWIAATAAGESYAFEPHLFAVYGDCGAVMHFDPRHRGGNVNADVFYMNTEYLLEKIDTPGELMQPIMSRPVVVSREMHLFDMGAVAKITKGRCGACKHMGCMPVPVSVNNTLLEIQTRRIRLANAYFRD